MHIMTPEMKTMYSDKYATIRIPRRLADKIVELAVQKLGTYRTCSEFVIEAARKHIESMETQMKI